MQHYWLLAAIGLCIVALVLLLTRLVANYKRRETLLKMGFSPDAPITVIQMNALRTFEDTDLRLKKSFPGISEAQRSVIVRDVLRSRGILPQRKNGAT
jgi:hypothetical protein